MVTHQVFTHGDIYLSYRQWGQDTPPILLLHGLADHGGVWSSLGQFLAPHYRVIAPDLRGHGDSSKPATGYFFKDYLQDLNAFTDDLGLRQFCLLGHSWGAKLAAIWARQNPEKITKLILVDPFFINSMPSWFTLTFPLLYRVLPFLKTLATFPDYPTLEKVGRSLKQYQGWTPLQEEVFRDSVEQKADGTWGSKFVVQARNEIFQDVMQIAGLTETIGIPTLLVIPEKGLNRTSWQLQPYKTYLKNLQIQKVPGNHWAFLVEPAAFNQQILSFVIASLTE